MAVSSAAGAAGRAIVRLSGPRAVAAAAEVFRADDGRPLADLPTWSVVHGSLDVSAFVVPVPTLLYLMRAPHSYTREDVVEFHVVGSPPVAAAVLAEMTARGVRLARPGEFTERAYLSGRIDLSQAEAVLKLIHARSDAERRLALDELTGELSTRIDRLTDDLVGTLTRVELELDFSEDDVPVVGRDELSAALAAASADLDELRRSGTGRYVFTERARLAVVGRTNVGKSSLFNRLLGRDEAIVTDVHGTTRDVLEAEIDLDDVQILLVDTAGEKTPTEKAKVAKKDTRSLLCEAPSGPTGKRLLVSFFASLDPPAGHSPTAGGGPDEIALERARAELDHADLVLLVIDASEPLTPVDLTLLNGLDKGSRRALIVLNKIDLPIDAETERTVRRRGLVVPVSCVTGEGLEGLRRELVQALTTGGVERQGLRFVLNLRQLDALRAAGESLARARDAVEGELGLEFPAADLRAAVNHLRELTHPLDEQEILDHIFSRFCIGK